MPDPKNRTVLSDRSDVLRWRIGYAVLILIGALGTWVFGGAWFFAGMCLGYIACMWVLFADPKRAREALNGGTNA